VVIAQKKKKKLIIFIDFSSVLVFSNFKEKKQNNKLQLDDHRKDKQTSNT